MYNQGNINLTYHNGILIVENKIPSGNNITKPKPSHEIETNSGDKGRVQLQNLTVKYEGEVKSSCEGYITFADNKQETFRFNEKNKEIVWNGPDARDNWIRGWSY